MSAARDCNRAGQRVVLINDGPLGGDCTFTGCVPSKAIISAAARGVSFREAFEHAATVVGQIADTENAEVLRGEGVEVLEGRGRFRDPHTIEVDGTVISYGSAVVATGSGPFVPPIPGLDQIEYLTNENIFELRTAPSSMAVLGGGPIGCELAQALQRLGVQVTVFEMADRLLTREEPESSAVVQSALEYDGVTVHVGAGVTRAEPTDHGIRLHTDELAVEVESLLVAVGRTPTGDGAGLDTIGVELDARGHVVVDDQLRTSVANVFAVGDVTGLAPFTHAADEMGRVAAANTRARHRRLARKFDAGPIPWVTFVDPEVARVGITESEAAAFDGDVAYLPMTENDRAITEGRTEGFVKLIAGPRKLVGKRGGGELLGATVVAARGGEMIHEPALAMRTGMFIGRLAQTVHAYPSWSVAIQKAAAQFFVEVEGRRSRPARR